MPFMKRALSKEIMTRTRLQNNSLKYRSEENKRKYSKQRNYCVSPLRKSKSEYFGNLNETKIQRWQNILENHEALFIGLSNTNSENYINRERRDYYGWR